MKAAPIKQIELNMDDLERLLQRAEAKQLDDGDYATIKALIESYVHLARLVEDKRTTIDRLRKLLFGSGSEKTREVLKDQGQGASSTTPDGDKPPKKADPEKEPTAQPKGHGRNGAEDYEGAERVPVSHPSLRSGVTVQTPSV